MSGFLDRLGDFFFKDPEQEVVPERIDERNMDSGSYGGQLSAPERNIWKEQEPKRPVKKTHLMSIPTREQGKEPTTMEMVLVKATSYDDMQEIANHIKDRKVAVVNFEEMDKEVAQRMVDFLSGATFALDGVPRKVSGGTFIFSSSNVDMSGQIMEKDNSFSSPFGESGYNPRQWMKK